jgi:hypothetical protein
MKRSLTNFGTKTVGVARVGTYRAEQRGEPGRLVLGSPCGQLGSRIIYICFPGNLFGGKCRARSGQSCGKSISIDPCSVDDAT